MKMNTHQVVVKNATGAGDTFAGAYIATWEKTKDLQVSLKSAIEAATNFISQ